MKRIIDGKIYDTETATEICDISPSGMSSGDFRWEDTRLYRTKKGAFFLAGEGGPMSRWAKSYGQNGSTSGYGIVRLSMQEARDFAERHAEVETVAKYFPVEEA